MVNGLEERRKMKYTSRRVRVNTVEGMLDPILVLPQLVIVNLN